MESANGKIYPFYIYLSTWLHRLCGIRYTQEYGNSSVELDDESNFFEYPGFIEDDNIECPMTSMEDEDDYARFIGKTFEGIGLPATPKFYSAGFHQIFPIIVQCGLMKRGEILMIENPEVHLHPRLQVQIAEFLMHHARSGRNIVIETHSDLVVRRLLRAQMQGYLGKEIFRIQFSSLTADKSGHYSSRLEDIQVDSLGFVQNWPDGFLDVDTEETRLMLRIMSDRIEN